MAYTKQTWANLPNQTTPLSAARLANIENGIESASTAAGTDIADAGALYVATNVEGALAEVKVAVTAIAAANDASVASFVNNPASATTTALSGQYAPVGRPTFNGTVYNGFRGLALRSSSGLAVTAAGELVASVPTVLGTATIPIPLVDPFQPFRFGAIVELSATNDTGYVEVTFGDTSPIYTGVTYRIQTATGFAATGPNGAGGKALFSGQTITPGVYHFYAISDGANVAFGITPAIAGGVTAFSSTVYVDGRDNVTVQAVTAPSLFPTTAFKYSSISEIQISISSASHKLRSVYCSVGTAEAPEVGATLFTQQLTVAGVGVGAPSNINVHIRGRSSDPTDLVIVAHANGSDHLNNTEISAHTKLLDAGYMLVYVAGDVEGTYSGRWHSPWCGPDGVRQVKAAMDAVVALHPSIRRVYGLGSSMGLSTLLTFEHTYPGVLSAVVGISGVTNLSYGYSSEGFSSLINLGNGVLPLATPTGVNAVQGGTTGATTYGYRVAARDAYGTTLAAATVSIANGNAALSVGSPVTVSWTAIPGATTYVIYGRTSGSELLMGYSITTSFVDNGSRTPAGALPGANTTGFTPSVVAHVADRDPTLRVADLVGLPQKIWFGTADTILSKTKHADDYVTALTAAGGTITAVTVTGGAHLDATMLAGVAGADVVAFFAAN